MFINDTWGVQDDRARARDLDCDWAELPSPRAQPPQSSRPPSARPSSPVPQQQAALVSQRHTQLSRLNHFELLGVAETADSAAIAAAFARETQRFHPDRLSGRDERLRPLASAIVGSIAQAYKVLGDEARRRDYLSDLERRRQGAAGGAAADPDELLQAARSCLRRGRTRDAAVLIEHACGVAPHNVRCRASLAWLDVLLGRVRPSAVGRELLGLLSQAVAQYPDDLELRMYRARALQRLGRTPEALRDFSFVASTDPHNVDAARELRLHQLRASDRPATSGVFSRLLARGESRPAPKSSHRAPAASDARPQRSRER